MTKLNLKENELAERWGVSPKTLQRWRTERRGPPYLKLSKRVAYPLEDILAFENGQKVGMEGSLRTAIRISAVNSLPEGHDPNASGAPEVVMIAHNDRTFVTAPQVIYVTGLPRYYFLNAEMRARLEIPHYLIGRLVRFKLDEIRQWERAKGSAATTAAIDPIAAILQQGQSAANRPGDEVDRQRQPDQVSPTDQQRSAPGANAEPLSTLDRPKMKLHEALRRLNDGTLSR